MYIKIKDDLKNLNLRIYEKDIKNKKESIWKVTDDYKILNSDTGEIFQNIEDIKNIKMYEKECLKIKLDYHKSSKEVRTVTNQIRSLKRTKENMIDLINYNYNYYTLHSKEHIKFITLTFKENIIDNKIANQEFKLFIKRLRYIYKEFSYIAVVERQKRGAIHYHIIFFNLPFVDVKELYNLWGNGFIDVQSLSKIGNVGFYMTKVIDYMCKELTQRDKSQKIFFTSRNIKKIKELYLKVSDLQIAKVLNYAKDNNIKIYEYENIQNLVMLNIKKEVFYNEVYS